MKGICVDKLDTTTECLVILVYTKREYSSNKWNNCSGKITGRISKLPLIHSKQIEAFMFRSVVKTNYLFILTMRNGKVCIIYTTYFSVKLIMYTPSRTAMNFLTITLIHYS